MSAEMARLAPEQAEAPVAALFARAHGRRVLASVALWTAYVLGYPRLFQAFGPDVAMIFAFAVVPIGLLFGTWGGLVAAALALPLNHVLLARLGPEALGALYSDWAGAVTGLVGGVAAGAARDLLRRIRSQAAALERERVRLEAEIQRAERSERELARTNQDLEAAREAALRAARAKSVLLGRASHELRTPVAAILGYVELLQEESAAGSPSNLARDLSAIHHSTKHLASLLDDLLDITRLEAGTLTPRVERVQVGALVEAVKAVAAPLAERRGNTFVMDVDRPDAEVMTDPRRLEQVLLNLLSNACKFTDRGRVVLSARAGVRGGVVLSVSDSGIGMTAEQSERAFDEFYQADPTSHLGGTGLGLAITRHLCQLLGASITIDSAPGQGTTFRVHVPFAPGCEPAAMA
jgi:signal transduction histidine kinase